MFSAMHYRELAKLLQELKPPVTPEDSIEFTRGRHAQWERTVTQMCEMFSSENPRFKRGLFEAACMGLGKAKGDTD